jgi:hypothetical protein
MSYELVKRWLDDLSDVTSEEINEAYDAMFQQMPSGPNICLIAALSIIKNSGVEGIESVRERMQKYEQENNS